MNFYFNSYSTPLLFGFMQGWVYAILLWVRGRREERLSDVLLGWVLVGMCFNIWEYMLGFGGLEFLWRELEFFPRTLGFLFPPLCYFYLKSQFNADFRFSRRDLWHAVPFLLDAGYHVLVFLQGPAFVERWKETVHYPFHIEDITYVLSTGQDIGYLYLSLRLYREYRAWIKTQFSDTETISFRWFRNFLLALTISSVVSFTVTLLDIWLDLTYWQDWWDELFGAVLIYYVSIAGYSQPQPARRLVFSDTPPIRPDDTSDRIAAQSATDPLPVPANNEVTIEPNPDIQEWKEKLLVLMAQEKPYLEPELSLSDLARRMHTNSSVLSQVINAGTGRNFNDFVNEYRVEEFKQQVSKPANSHLSLLGIALECGFNSKATFNRAFKKFTGVSPKTFADDPTKPDNLTVASPESPLLNQ
ncbi:AraC family transcriptional regulator [Fibrisoma montanum]|uniref:AraC family transcriptional regulator n=1 Tax=Fibrisoma montanum TaxID=2305895 RepID=A0A418LW59_9BACT|nr:AraC family transcriptional regulator [Fibrisoma montanum]RIV17551.1 AraC family transcriptional regulator [Fibrisoma montanum]